MYLKVSFIIFALLLFLTLCTYKLIICKRKRTEKTALYVSFMGAILLLYVLYGIILSIFIPAVISKIIIFLFSISPFIIGKIATYEKEGLYSFIQIICVGMSLLYSFVV